MVNVMKKYMEMGKIVNTHGIKGNVKAESWGDDIEELLDFDFFYVGSQKKIYQVEKAQMHGNAAMIKFVGVDDVEAAQSLKNQILYMDREALEPLKEGTYYTADLFGLKVFLENGALLGKVADVMKTGANDVLIVRNEGKKEVLIPFIHDCIKDVDFSNESILITPIEGLLDL